jgi:hypothetical protein
MYPRFPLLFVLIVIVWEAIIAFDNFKEDFKTNGPSSSKVGFGVKFDFAGKFFTMAMTRYQVNRSSGLVAHKSTNAESVRSDRNGTDYLPVVHLLRIPKAGSSALSAVARRLVGCQPPGPCCKWPGDPVGSCPSKPLFACQEQQRVLGCTHHFPLYRSLLNDSIVTLTMVRDPILRAVSGYFYGGIHSNRMRCTTRGGGGGALQDNPRKASSCFTAYLQDARWQDVALKMLTGAYAYAPKIKVCRTKAQCLNSLELAKENVHKHVIFAGISEMWELSLLVLHAKLPSTIPEASEFYMFQQKNSSSKSAETIYLT